MVNAEHEALRDTVRTLLDRTADSALVRTADGYSEPLWRALADQVGVAGLTVPEQYDGAGATLLEAHIALEETGRTLAPVPVLSSLLAAQALIRCGNEEARARLLPEIAAGRVATVGWQDDGYVLDGDIAETTLMVSGDNLYEIVPTHRERKPTMDFTRRLAKVEFDLTQASHLGAAAPELRDIARAALSAEQVGTAQRCLDMTVDYTKTRVQFGRPIGGFQALKHRMADMYVLVETARSIATAAASDLSLASTAKVHCSEALSTVAGEMVQLHGGIAITWEHDAHLYFKRAHGSRQLFGGPDELRSSLRAAAR
ncbi:acyl-CoA dehydrogenase family protein [Actinocrispum sp. NPDC049592]|uniref:acyl-CoA dehydrogenase family protein n=1 Tax=Actinocrispum sp. NPDC049592 TaxID=3154835 RepID=UPI003441FFE9